MTSTQLSPPSPPTDPNRPNSRPRRERSSSNDLLLYIALTIVAAALIGVAVAGGSLFSNASGTNAKGKIIAPYAIAGAITAMLLAAIGVVAFRFVNPDRERPSRWRLLAIFMISAMLGALIGAALTPPQAQPEDVSPLTEEEMRRRSEEYGGIPKDSRASPVDRDSDGQPDLDENGDPIIGYDSDGNGTIDGYLVPCPPNSPQPTAPPILRAGITGRQAGPVLRAAWPSTIEPPDGETDQRLPRGAIDYECDGTIDEIIEYDDEFLAPQPGGPGDQFDQPETPDTIAPQERSERAEQKNSDKGFDGRFLLKLAAIVGCAALVAAAIVWLLKNRRDEQHIDDDEEPPSEPAINESVRASITDLLQQEDPRAGILTAYGRLLKGFADLGLPRLAPEAPDEYLNRCLATTTLPAEAAKELTNWYTLARFSPHPIDESHRDAAVAALRRFLAETGQSIDEQTSTLTSAPPR